MVIDVDHVVRCCGAGSDVAGQEGPDQANPTAADDAHLGRHAPVCERNAGRRGDRRQRRHAGHHLEQDARLCERERFLAATPEDERVPSLQPNDLEALRAEIDEEVVDPLLVEALARDRQSVGGSFGDELRSDEPVKDERIATAHELEAARGDETRVTGAGADEPDGHESASATSCSK